MTDQLASLFEDEGASRIAAKPLNTPGGKPGAMAGLARTSLSAVRGAMS
jgi:hypothetical protein